jgi:hypothetical protein
LPAVCWCTLPKPTVVVDVYRIEAADPYPEGYEATVERNATEQREDARPAIANPLPLGDGYDTMLLGSGIWNVQPPMIMRTFVESVDLTGMTIRYVRDLRGQRTG